MTFDSSNHASFATTNASNRIEATAADPAALVTIMNGDAQVSSGSSASWNIGDNTLTIKVSNQSDPTIYRTYEVTVTRS